MWIDFAVLALSSFHICPVSAGTAREKNETENRQERKKKRKPLFYR